MGTVSRRSYFSSTVAALGGLLAAACDPFGSSRVAGGPGRRTSTAPELTARRKGPLAIRVLYGPWQGPIVSEVEFYVLNSAGERIAPQKELYRVTAFATFRERHPGSSVTLEVAYDTLRDLRARHAAGSAPDIFLVDDVRGMEVIRHQLAARLDGLTRQWPDQADFIKSAWEAGKTGGQQWGVPLFTQVYTWYYNQPLLRALGFAQPPNTWEKLIEVARESTTVSAGQVVRKGITGPSPQWFWWLLQATGATLYEHGSAGFDHSTGAMVLQFLHDLNRAVQPSGARPLMNTGPSPYHTDHRQWSVGDAAHAWIPDLPRLPREQALRYRSEVLERVLPQPDPTTVSARPTLSPEVSATVEARRRRRPQPGDIVVGTPPVPGGSSYSLPSRSVQPLAYAHTAVLHISKTSDKPDQAWELLTLLLEPDTLYAYTNLRQAVPPRQSILGRGYLQSESTQQVVGLWRRYGRPPFNPPRYAAVSQAIEATFQAVVGEQQSPAEGARQLVEQLDEIARTAKPPYTGTTRR